MFWRDLLPPCSDPKSSAISGKTTTLAGRFVHLSHDGVDPRSILALTFTKKAADEMKARIAAALALSFARDLNITTFHAFAFRHLRRNPPVAGLC
jgi:DNA helicase-2/ATP-dependent DNA helicase PcrA